MLVLIASLILSSWLSLLITFHFCFYQVTRLHEYQGVDVHFKEIARQYHDIVQVINSNAYGCLLLMQNPKSTFPYRSWKICNGRSSKLKWTWNASQMHRNLLFLLLCFAAVAMLSFFASSSFLFIFNLNLNHQHLSLRYRCLLIFWDSNTIIMLITLLVISYFLFPCHDFHLPTHSICYVTSINTNDQKIGLIHSFDFTTNKGTRRH